MLILSRVCADFHDSHGHLLFSVTPATRNTFINAPDTIREDPLFDLLCTDGSLEAGITQAQQRQMENDPDAGHDASGKLIPPEVYTEQAEAQSDSGTEPAVNPNPAASGNDAPVASGSGKSTRNKKAEPAG